jgi:hypothetical protein
MTTIKTPAQQTVVRLKGAWADMNYAQQRLLDIRLGLPTEDSGPNDGESTPIEQLEAQYRLQTREPRVQVPAR